MDRESTTLEDLVKELVMLRQQVRLAREGSKAWQGHVDDAAFLQALSDLDAMASEPGPDILRRALESAVRLTSSETGWVGILSSDEAHVVQSLWSGATAAGCTIPDVVHSISVRNGGLWNRPVIEKAPLIVNDYSAPDPRKKGMPLGHVPICRLLGVPVLDGGRVLAIVEVGNKPGDYDQADVWTVTMLFASACRIIGQKRAGRELDDARAQLDLLLELLGKGIYSMELASLAEMEMALGARTHLDMTLARDRQLLEQPLQTLINITGVIDDIKAAYRDQGNFGLIEMDLGPLLAGIRDKYAAMPQRHVTINYVPSPGCCVRANALLTTVFSGLIENMIKGSGPGRRVTIDISTMSLQVEGRDYYAVTIEATGPGTGNQQSAPGNEGNGCRGGLQYALIKTIVGHFDGRMWAEDLVRGEPGGGCRAIVMLPKA